ncbi:hypothetical protein ROJ8625_01545 [Roseivivax jejudonensis]|uniref:Capsule polysaccharide biosynthesis protein n=1 Tax=Roseivivax jejudonensis TaxID=1529041 RepID=A0A1X6YW82_9RHOB|nr:hypothetical protein [Roseivivax jejudonensis]SLN33120.1 hypothetical protein ROJ8625_01545 [Roseivivax jejudonensis]
MKVLIHVEPHGLRDGFAEFEAPLRRFLPVLEALNRRPGWEGRLLCNPLMADLVLAEAPHLWPLVLQPDPDTRRALQRDAIAWDAAGQSAWTALMQDPEAPLTRAYVALLELVRAERFAFDAVVLWGDNAAVRAVCTRAGLPRAHLELASFRAPFAPALLIDPEGVNGGASTARLGADAFQPHPALGAPDRAAARVRPPALRPAPSPPAAHGPAPVALVPLQLSDDANVLLYSPYSGPEAMLDAVLPRLLGAGFAVDLKPHPGARIRGGEVWDTQTRALARWRTAPGVTILPDPEPAEALPARLATADLVVGLNSSVLFETTLLGGIAVPLGAACFAPPGAHPDLDEALEAYADPAWRAAWHARAAGVAEILLATAFVPEEALVPALLRRLALWRDPGARGPRAALDALAWQDWPDDPETAP